MIPIITFYTTDGCHLCEAAHENIRAVRSAVSFQLETIDIQDKYETYEIYKDDIPVILVNGTEIGRHHISVELITQKIKEFARNA